jgi:hypothetical protein
VLMRGGCKQSEGPGLGHGVGTGVGAELRIEVAHVRDRHPPGLHPRSG